MQIVQHDLAFFDPKVPEGWFGLALEAVSEQGERTGTIAARVDGPIAVIFERWVTGEMHLLTPLMDELISRLRSRYQIRQLRAGASDDRFYTSCLERFGMTLWCHLVRYERSRTDSQPKRMSIAVTRPFRDGDELPLNGLLGATGGAVDLVRMSQHHQSRFVVAEIDQRVIGYALSYVDGPWCLLKSMVVDPSFRKRGIGWDLVCDSIDWARSLDLPSCLNTQADNIPARNLYEHLGYHETARVRLVHRLFD